MSRISELNDQLEAVRNQKAYLIRHGAENTDQGIVDLEEREADIFRMISEEEKRETQETIIAEVNDPESSFNLSASGFVADFRALAAGEDEYQMLSVTTRLFLAQLEREHAEEIKAIKDSFNSDLASASDKNNALEDELEQTRADLADVRGKLEIANNKMTDLEMECDSAVKEAEALRKQVEELREQITEKPKVATNLDGREALAEISARLEAKKIPVYNVRAGDNKTSFYLAQLAENGEEIEIRPYYELKSKYRELSVEEAARFRQEVEEAKQTELESTPEAEITPEPVEEQFRPDLPFPELSNVDATDGLDENNTEREDGQNGEGGAVTVEARLTALELAVFGQAKAAA